MNKFTIIFLFLFAASFWVFWLPGPRVATDYYLSSSETIKDNSFPWVWRENTADGLGEYTAGTLWSYPIHFFFRILSELNISVIWITKILLILILCTGFFSIVRLLSYLKIEGAAKYVGALFYLLNTFFLLLIDGGQLSLAFVYCLVPLCVYFYLKTIDEENFKNRLNFIASLLLVSFLDIRFILILFLIFFVHLIFHIIKSGNRDLKLVKNLFISGLFGGLILIFAHSYWLLPTIFSHSLQLPQTYERTTQVDFLSWSSLAHSIFMQQPHWYRNVFGNISNIKIEFSLIPILVFLNLIFKRDKIVGFWLIIAVLGIFLSKGSKEPFGQIYTWAFINIPLFSLFRDPVKFYLMIGLSYSILISISVSKISILNTNKKIINKLIKFVPTIIFLYLILLAWPVYFKQMTGMFSEPRDEQEFSKQSEIFTKDFSFSRILWIPTQNPLGYSSINHPSVAALRLSQKRPFAVGIKGTYETLNFLREASFIGEIFDIAGIGYIDYPYLDSKRDEMSFDHRKYFYTFLHQLSKLSWLNQVEESKIPLFRTNQHQDKFFIAPDVWWVIGSDNIYNEATKSADLKLSKNALIFAEEKAGLGERIDELPRAKIVLNDKGMLDLAATFINNDLLIFPARQLDFAPNNSGWWKREAVDLVDWRAFLQTKYRIDNQDFDLGGGWAVGEGNKQLKIDNVKLRKGNFLLARVLESTRSGELKFSQNGQLVGSLSTKREGNNIRWFEVGKLLQDGKLEITSFGDINVVNALAILKQTGWDNFKDKAEKEKTRIVSFDEKNVNNNYTRVTYQQINPTKYLVTISNLTQSSFLIFSQNYDSLWQINGQTPLPIYSLLNGFKIDRNGQYIVEFSAQKYVNFGLIISGLTVISLVLLRFL